MGAASPKAVFQPFHSLPAYEAEAVCGSVMSFAAPGTVCRVRASALGGPACFPSPWHIKRQRYLWGTVSPAFPHCQ